LRHPSVPRRRGGYGYYYEYGYHKKYQEKGGGPAEDQRAAA
jgi:hypothetical protein